jgi:hypothetical protein
MFTGRLISLHVHVELRGPRNLSAGTTLKTLGAHKAIYRPMCALDVVNVVIIMQGSLFKHVATPLRCHLGFSILHAVAQFCPAIVVFLCLVKWRNSNVKQAVMFLCTYSSVVKLSLKLYDEVR